MVIAALVLGALSLAVLLVWITRHGMISHHRRHAFVLREDYQAPPSPGLTADLSQGERRSPGAATAPANPLLPPGASKNVAATVPRKLPSLTVVVAAKDEEANIERCIRSLAEQEYPDYEVIVANDRSTDRTGAIVADLARQYPHVRLLNMAELPEGWCGKNNAMQTAIAASRGEWICMIDADCWQTSRQTLRAAVAYAADEGVDFFSLLPQMVMQGFWENVIQPVCGGVLVIWFPPDKVNDPQAPHAYANGAFMLIRRRAYEQIGTHAAVRNQVNEDIHLARRIKEAGLRLRVVRNEGLYETRMYTSFRGMIRGWSRIYYGTFGSLGRLLGSLAYLVVLGLLPYAAAAFGIAAAWGDLNRDSHHLFVVCAGIGLAAAVAQLTVVYRFRRMMKTPGVYVLTYPLGCLVACWTVLVAISKLRKGAKISWRSTHYARKP